MPSAVPPAIRLTAQLSVLLHLPIHNGITRRTLHEFQVAAPGGRPGIERKRLSPTRSRFERITNTRQPIQRLCISNG